MITHVLAKNVHLHLHPTQKFKDVTISIRFLSNLQSTNLVARYFLSNIISDRCKTYPSKLEVTQHLDQLYGASLDSSTQFLGLGHSIEFRCSAINSHYVKKDLFSDQMEFLSQFIFSPILDDPSLFETIKDRLVLMVQSSLDQPQNYANNRSKELFGSTLKSQLLPTKQEILDCTLETVQEAYQKMIHDEIIHLFILGDIEENTALQLSKQFFNFEDRCNNLFVPYLAQKEEFETVVEEKKVNQAQLILLYTTDKNVLSEDHFALLIGNGLFGTFPSSFLFQEVREKRSLCYSISSTYISYDGLLKVQTAIDSEKQLEVTDLIQEQCKKIKIGDFTEEHLEVTKKMFISLLRSSYDSQQYILTQDYRNQLSKRESSLEDVILSIQHVTKEDIIKAFSTVHCKLVYCLKQGGTHE